MSDTMVGVQLTAAAAAKVQALLAAEARDDLLLRVGVQPGGCSGMRYELFFDDRVLDGDVLTEIEGVRVAVDKMSAAYLNGATLDYADSLEKQGFDIQNPNATHSCGCGSSFC